MVPLHIKYRPQSFDDVVGNKSTVESLKHVVRRTDRVVKSFLFSGPSGCGKTTLARILRNEWECGEKDFYEYNMANTRGIDTIREIIANSIYSPISGKVKVYLMDEAHKQTGDSQNSLLKILEDTPDHVRFVLCTTDPEKLIVTIRNRCSAYQVYPLVRHDMVYLLRKVCRLERINVDPKVLLEIIKSADGSPRHALVLLEQVSDISDVDLALQTIGGGILSETKVKELCRCLLSGDWNSTVDVLKGLTIEPETARYAVLGYMNSVLLGRGKASDRAAVVIGFFSESFMYSGKAGLTMACYYSCR